MIYCEETEVTICADCPADSAELAQRYGLSPYPSLWNGDHYWINPYGDHLGKVDSRALAVWHALKQADDRIVALSLRRE